MGSPMRTHNFLPPVAGLGQFMVVPEECSGHGAGPTPGESGTVAGVRSLMTCKISLPGPPVTSDRGQQSGKKGGAAPDSGPRQRCTQG